ncbi:hypothetical protein [Micromonospora mirobrigensis]|uniref:hypothetical protein n=1 Tax=Micromonospora mirobrigensis TaxID=262898 RepID=UPI001FE2231F|nr:hypothetical protein [Micromonospora mirobrigensis]
MIRIELDEPTLARTRIATSPLWETITSLWLLHRNEVVPWPYTGWAEAARRALAEDPRTAPLRVYAASRGRLPDCFMPIPAIPAPTIDEELAVLRATPAELLRAQLPAYVTGSHRTGCAPTSTTRPQRTDGCSRRAAAPRSSSAGSCRTPATAC